MENLSTAVYHHLPREIRNYIYSYCIQSEYDDEVIVRRRTDPSGTIMLLVRETLGPYSYRWIEDPITSLINVSVLGNEVAREMLESYYRGRKFKISHRDLLLVETFLKADTFHLNVSPGSHVRRLELDIHLETSMKNLEMAEPFDEHIGLAMEALGANVTGRTDIAIGVCRNNHPLPQSGKAWECASLDHKVSPRILEALESLRNRRPRARIMYRQTWRD
jgi:hypothetical protein